MIFLLVFLFWFSVSFPLLLFHHSTYNQLRWTDSSGLFPLITWDYFGFHYLVSLFLFWKSYPVCKEKEKASTALWPSDFSAVFWCWDAWTLSSHFCFFYCSAQQQPDFVATSQIQHSPLTRRMRPSYSRTSPWEHADNYLKHRRERSEKTSVVRERLFHKHLQVSFINRRLLQESSAFRAGWKKSLKCSFLWLSLLQQLGLSLKFKLTFIPGLQFHFVPQSKISCIIVCI